MPVQTPNTKADQDNAYNPEELHAAERFPEAYAQHGIDQLEAHLKDTASASTRGGQKASADKKAPDDGTAATNDVRQKEESGGDWKNNYTGARNNQKKSGVIKTVFSRKGPIILIMSLLGIGGGVMTGTPSLLPISLRSTIENFYGNVSRTNQFHDEETLRYRVGNTGACADASSIRCKMATVSEDTEKRYVNSGFKVDSEKFGDRKLIRSMTFPDGTTVNDGNAAVAHSNSSVSAKSKLFSVFNPRSGPYVGKSFTEKVLNKFGLTKAKVTLSGKDREATSESFNREVGAPEDASQDAENERRQTETDVKGKAAKVAGKVTNVAGLACAAYDMSRVTLAIVRFKNSVKYAAFGYLFLKLADQIRAGDADSVTIGIAAAALTKVAASGDFKGKSAMDSPGMKTMMYGDREGLRESARSILLGGNPALKKLDDSVSFIKEQFGADNVRTVCRASDNFVVGAGITAALCGASGGTAGTILPGLGNAVGGLGGVALCTGANIAISLASGVIIGYIIDQIMPSVIAYLTKKPLNYDLGPEDTGNALAIAGGIIFGTAGMSKGLKPATKVESEAFQKVAFEADREYAAVARYDAKDTPLDITNQYSFASQFLNQVTTPQGSNIVATALSSITTTLANAQSSLLTSAAYAADMPSPVKAHTLGECADAERAEKNFACDNMDQVQMVQSNEELKRPTEESLNYMVGNDYITSDGTINPDKEYAKYMKYCTAEGSTLPGNSDLSVSDDDYEWPETRCWENSTMISNFRTYTSRIERKDDEDTYYKGDNTGAAPQATVTEGADIDGDDYKAEVRKVLGRAGTGQCVDFVLFRLVKHGVLDGPIALGNGKDVVGTLGRMGYKVDTTPAVHSVMSTPVTSTPEYGHTAMVSQVNADGSFVVEEYNFATAKQYGTRTIPASDIKSKKMTFAHTEVDYK